MFGRQRKSNSNFRQWFVFVFDFFLSFEGHKCSLTSLVAPNRWHKARFFCSISTSTRLHYANEWETFRSKSKSQANQLLSEVQRKRCIFSEAHNSKSERFKRNWHEEWVIWRISTSNSLSAYREYLSAGHCFQKGFHHFYLFKQRLSKLVRLFVHSHNKEFYKFSIALKTICICAFDVNGCINISNFSHSFSMWKRKDRRKAHNIHFGCLVKNWFFLFPFSFMHKLWWLTLK